MASKMMLNILLLGVGATATLAAFGGKTWVEGDEKIYERITRRGWISLGCLLAALILGITKEVKTQIGAEASLKEGREVRMQLESTQSLLAEAQLDLVKLRRNASFQPVIRGAPVRALLPGRRENLRVQPYAGSKLEVLGFDCPIAIRTKSANVNRQYRVQTMQSEDIPVIGLIGERVNVEIERTDRWRGVPEGMLQPCLGKIFIHSAPFLEAGVK